MKYKLHHVLIWMLVFGTWFLFRYEGYSLPATAFKVTLIKVIDLAALVYFTNYVLIPKLLYKKKYVLFAVILISLIVLSSLLKMNIIGRMTNNPALLNISGNWKGRVYDNVIPHFFLVLAGAAFKLMFDYTAMQKKMADMAKEKAEAELSFLKSQINPHFLFNSINAVYFLIDKENKEAREALHKFSDMLRYQLYEAGGDKIPIEKEIDFLNDYVALQKLRKDDQYKVDFSADTEVKGFSIEPLLLVSFVENAFKHISHRSNETNYVKVKLSKTKGTLDFQVENSKEDAISIEKNGGIGLQNVKRRLELLYPGKYDLNIQNGGEVYSVHLKLHV
ncbi:histidine kinase [Lacibacter sp. H375]|uniref:sensor histidine kinase n=1 Tax=Lacibacter sp. H375 TaxID=3133424 RepID=UPI0030C2927B